ncbi:MAG: fibronectin type III domain-containing protein, partial [Minisyncoccia bacterium]
MIARILRAGLLCIAGASVATVVSVSAAEISEVVANTTDSGATITWTTDVAADSMVNYSLDPDFGILRDSTLSTEHSIVASNLDPSTTYYFQIISADASGNRISSGGNIFTTKGSVAQKIIKDLPKITNPDEIKEIQEAVKEQASDVLKPPTILGATKVVVDMDRAEISWTTDRESGSTVHLAPEGEFNAESADPYSITQGDANELVTRHYVEVVGLEPGTVYHFKVVSEDSSGLSAETEDDTFRTKSQLPKVTNITVTRVQEDAATINWQTSGVLAKGTVEYTNTRTNAKKSIGNPVFAAQQSVRLADLEFGTRYSAVITATNESGDNEISAPFTFITVRDVIAPAIAKVKNESTLYPGEDTKIQTIVSWETDEPALCQVFYIQGLVRTEGDNESMPKESNPLTAHTQVIIGFAPATVYKFWVECEDEARNSATSEDFVLITPIKEKNIIDVILENFEG